MTVHHGESLSIWNDTFSMPSFKPLSKNITTDVCIIGGGIAGLTTAYLLMKEGRKVCVLEAYDLASGQSGRTTAHFSNALDDRFFNLERFHGEEGLRLIINSHSEAIRKVMSIVKREGIDCEMKEVSGYLFSLGDKHTDVLAREYEAAYQGGLVNVEPLPESPFPNVKIGECLHFPKQMQLHPVKYLNGLAKKIIEGGGQIFTNTHVSEVFGGKEAFVKTDEKKTVFCQSIVVATNTPINDLFAIHTKQASYRTYVVGFKIPKETFPDILLWDTLDPYHYIRVEHLKDFDVLIVGGEDHKTGQESDPKARYSLLEEWTRAHFPYVEEVLYRWSGQILEPVDGLAYLGRNPMDDDNVYVITGDSGNGMTHGTIGAMLITDQIMQRENIWEKVYSPSRISIRSATEYLKENLNTAAQYIEWLDPKFEGNLQNLASGEGMIFRKSGKMMAAYKTEDGDIEYMSAVCPHLAGIVSWNTAEKSWDCPCHGSRFDCHGAVIQGPAISGLKQFLEDEEVPEKTEKFEETDFIT